IGFSSEAIREFGVPILYTNRVHPRAKHVADQNGELSLCAGAQSAVGPVKLQVNETDRKRVRSDLAAVGIDRYIVLSPGGGWRSKCWPAERFGELCRKIRVELNVRCVINYGPGEETLAATVKSASGNADPFPYDGQLGQLMALLRGAQCIVGGDTGPLHLAIALGTKAVAIFGPTNPVRNGPYPPQPFVLRDPVAATTHKRETETNPSLLKISVAQVFDAVKLHLGASS
ncbi:MAG TPA: glycosyltransferase family 9 protein, partial [Candidatus Acidoferrales bacterium]|nr:glycosyltransferase family 9 protein [Candidatus Acidoferrales bacterium]